MIAYTVRRLFAAIPTLIAASFLVFWLGSLSRDPVQEKYGARNPPVPQNALDEEYARLGLHDGFFEQYWTWITRVVTGGGFGPSINKTTNINAEIVDRALETTALISTAMVIAVVMAVVTGVLSAMRQYSKTDYTFTFLGFLFLGTPTFFFAVLLLHSAILFNEGTGTRYIFTVGARSEGADLHGWALATDMAGHLILPTISLSLLTYAALSRFQRTSMLEVLNSDYIRLARSKGLMPRRVLIRHALRTALIPMTTATALTIAALLGGAVITERVYDWDGMGKLLVDSITIGDRNAILAWLLLAGAFVVIGNLVADLLYAVLDPRIRYE